MMNFKNVEKFENWLKTTCRKYSGNLDAYLDDVERQYSASGAAEYELRGFETATGKPALYWFDVRFEEVEPERCETTISF